ncbi:MAG: outer membrane protein assembly factor BamA [Endomicrobia bacterium]|nr:outer membrane protein assembly factor BamA [Endomicrobiia bacterium]MCL2506891.1 outer membrane protein assembly factor BamA [Endomicrobiia bacterium]
MKKYFLSIIFLTVFFMLAHADTNVISHVDISGLINVKHKTVLSVIDAKKGKTYTPDMARDDVRAILELGYFDDVEVRFDKDTGEMVFIVMEKPYIENINFKGNKQFSKGKLKNESVLKEKDYYDLGKFEETKRKIMSLYKDAGFVDAQIDVYPTVDPDTNRMTINFLITENNKIVIGGIRIEGVIAFTESRILRLMKTKENKVFREDIFQNDLRAIEAFYKNNGFMDYKLVSFTDSLNEDRTKMFLTLNISEGIRYEIGNITFDGNFAVDDKEMKRLIKFSKGDIFRQDKIFESIQGIYEVYSDRGFLHTIVTPSFDKGARDGIVDINLSVKENSVVYVGNIYVDGLVSTKEKVIKREILVKEGSVLAAGKVRRSVERIYNLGFIEAAEPQILPTGSPDIMDLVFNITEGKPGMITAGAGYSSVDQFVGSVQFQHMNLFGLGQRLNLLWEFGSRRQNYEIDWTEPWIFNKNASLTLSAYNIERKRDYGSVTDAYKENRLGLAAKVGPRISDTIALLFGYTYENVQLNDIDSRIRQQIEEATDLSKDRTSSVMGQIAYDTRDYIFDPSRGQRQLLSLQMAGGPFGGNVNFVKGMFKSTWFVPTFWKFVLSFNLNVGAIGPYGGQEDVPIYERFYVGGADTIRGYKYRTEVGPVDGGQFMSVLNVEYKFPIVAEKGRTVLQGAFFYDIGGTWLNFGDIKFALGTGERNLRSGVGFGIRFATPVFPLRLDWGYGLNHKPGEALQQFYFTIGNIF